MTEQHQPVDFRTFVISLSSSAMLHLGEIPDPDAGAPRTNLELARHTIDILSMLQAKTRGNLSREEEDLLQTLLTDLRMKYVSRKGG